MYYNNLLEKYEDEKFLVNMVSVDDIVRIGSSIGLNENSRVLDLCCGYGTMLKIWNQLYGINGVGIDRETSFIEKGRSRLCDSKIELICGDVLQYTDTKKYDVVICTELSTGLFDSFENGVAFLNNFVKENGILVFGKLFSEIPNPPAELIEFDGPLPTLSDIYNECKKCGYLITVMSSGTDASWERYIMGERSPSRLQKNRDDPEWAAWTDKWLRMYYDYRRPFENWALFGIEKL